TGKRRLINVSLTSQGLISVSGGEMSDNFDVVVVGGGAGGLFAANVANALGAKVCLVEKKRLGGDCTWFGCVPSKALLRAAGAAATVQQCSRFGLGLGQGATVSTDKVMGYVRDVVTAVSSHHPAELFEKRGIRVTFGSPCFRARDTLEVGGRALRGKRFILCTGSRPLIPAVPGLSDIDYLTNENVFSLDRLPESMIVLGGGPIGVELSQALGRLGAKVSLVEMAERILFREDKDAAKVVEKRLVKEGVDLLLGKKAVMFARRQRDVCVTVEDERGEKQQICAQRALLAVGRAPNAEGLGLEQAGVEYSPRGVKVNPYLQTTNPNIFACGDIVGPYMFSHIAAYQAGICARNASLRRLAWQKTNYDNVAWATFSDPELSHLGLTEEEARQRYGKIRVYKSDYTAADRAWTDGEKDGLAKIITDKRGYLLGAHIVGAQAAEVIQGLLVAKSQRIPLSKIASTLFIYPTFSEIIKKTAAYALIEKMKNPLVKWIIGIMKAGR
ncbi:MAG: dihydrolipoyl dehydrogenase family protein, partial [Candidatus Omnitrophota bacterium]